MGRRTTRAAAGERSTRPEPLAHDTTWAGEARSAVGYAALLCALLLGVDEMADTLTDPRAALWLGLAVLLALVLWPARVSVGRGRLAGTLTIVPGISW